MLWRFIHSFIYAERVYGYLLLNIFLKLFSVRIKLMTCYITTSLLTINHMQRDKMTIESSCCYFSVAQSCLTFCNPMDCSTPGFPVHHRPMSIESVIPSNHLVLCCPLFLLPLILPSIRVFSNESALCIRWSKHWSFSFIISPSNEYSGLISFRIDWSHLLADQIHYSNNWIVYLFIQSIAIEFPIKCQALF